MTDTNKQIKNRKEKTPLRNFIETLHSGKDDQLLQTFYYENHFGTSQSSRHYGLSLFAFVE